MEILIFAAGVSFVAGAIGYIIVRFWIIPIARYNKIKRQIAAALPGPATDSASEKGGNASPKSLRRHAGRLNDMYYDQMPHWYKMVLANRGESPEEAVKHLNTLAGIRKKAHADRRIEQIRSCLKLK